jgi:photosystem II stability/assembly factor-like uncharacterized protein
LAERLQKGTLTWSILDTVPYPGKQDDIQFVDRQTGWYVNGQGFIYKTVDGGERWTQVLHKPGTYFRALGMVDTNLGFAGNIGPDYFPGVTDATPLYRTVDGGTTWSAVKEVTSAMITGVCAIDVLKSKFVNAGQLQDRVTIRAAGRVGGPAHIVTSRDGGQTWKSQDMSAHAAMIFDIKFLDEQTGFVCAASHSDVAQAHARILKTKDGGKTWRVVYESKRTLELAWKCAFPTAKTGYASLLNYSQDPNDRQRYVAKTVDGGESWKEIPLAAEPGLAQFGVGFITEDIGWVGAKDGLWMTVDGGARWTHQKIGHAINKIRVVGGPENPLVFAIGKEVLRLK